MDETLRDLGDYIELVLDGKIIDWKIAFGELTVNAKRADITEVIRFCAMILVSNSSPS